jgi:hypothetical protein
MPTAIALQFALFLAFAPSTDYYQLERRSQEFTRMLTAGNSRQIFSMFVPQFQDEVGFQRFDSALSAWYAGRRIARAKSMVVNVSGLGGHASTWVFFPGKQDYSYVYQNWFYTDQGWKLAWLSHILNQSHQFGQGDTEELASIAQAGLGYLATPPGLNSISPGLRLPDTLVVVWHMYRNGMRFRVPGHEVVLLAPRQAGDKKNMPRAPFLFQIAAIRLLGNFATCAIDLIPTPPGKSGPLRRTRSTQLYFEDHDGVWSLHSLGRKW